MTLLVTAMDRLDLLEITLKSFLKFNTYPIKEILIRDDSGLDSVYGQTKALLDTLGTPYRLLDKGNLGQINSIDTLMKEVKTEYVFHTEDDWEYTRSGFIEDCLKIIDGATQIWIREQGDGVVAKIGELQEISGVVFYETERFSFNPHLRSMKGWTEYKKVTGGVCFEDSLSRGARTRWLKNGACRHIGSKKPCNRGGLSYQVRKA